MSDKNNNTRRPRIQPVSRETAYTKLKACSSFEEADRRLRLGWPVTEVARFIQEESGEYTDVTFDSLCETLSRYYATIPAAEKGTGVNSLVARKAAKALSDGLDEVEELKKLYEIQLERIEIDFQHEKNMNKLLPTTWKEIQVAMKLANQSAQLKMDLGLVKRQIGQLDVSAGQHALEAGERYGRESVGKVMADPEARRRVLGLAEKLLVLGAKAGIEAVELDKVIEEEKEKEASVIDVTPVEHSEKEGTGEDNAD